MNNNESYIFRAQRFKFKTVSIFIKLCMVRSKHYLVCVLSVLRFFLRSSTGNVQQSLILLFFLPYLMRGSNANMFVCSGRDHYVMQTLLLAIQQQEGPQRVLELTDLSLISTNDSFPKNCCPYSTFDGSNTRTNQKHLAGGAEELRSYESTKNVYETSKFEEVDKCH